MKVQFRRNLSVVLVEDELVINYARNVKVRGQDLVERKARRHPS
jgi:hypothetical protein